MIESTSFVNIQAIVLYLAVNEKNSYVSLKSLNDVLDVDQNLISLIIEEEYNTYGITDVITSLKRIYNIFDNNKDISKDVNKEHVKIILDKIATEYEAILKMPENKRAVYIENNINILKKVLLMNQLQRNIKSLKNIDRYEEVGRNIKNLIEIIDSRFDYANKNKEVLDFLNTQEIEVSVAKERITSGWEEFDNMLGGGIVKTSLAVLCGQPGVGKTSTLVNIASRAIQSGKSVLFFTFEELVSSISFYILQSTFKLDEQTLLKNQKKYINDFKNLLVNKNCNLYINEGLIKDKSRKNKGATFSFMDINNIIDRLLSKGVKIDFLVFDYIGKMARMVQEENLYMRVGNVAENLKEIARSMQIPVITAHQMNRMGWGSKEAGMENIADSVKIAHEADYMMFIIRSREDIKNNNPKLLLKVDKNRHGQSNITRNAIPDYSKKIIEIKTDEFGIDYSSNSYDM